MIAKAWGRKMTLTIDLTPAEELGLFEVARQQGLLPTEAAHRLLTAQLPRVPRWGQEQGLVQEYQALTTQERQGQLTEAQFVRLREVTAALDELEAHDPVEQEADRRVKETSTTRSIFTVAVLTASPTSFIFWTARPARLTITVRCTRRKHSAKTSRLW